MEIVDVSQHLPLKLLVVDDDDLDRERIRRMLAKENAAIEVSEACTIEDSIAFLNKSDYDCVIVDYRLGAHSGLTLLNTIRTHLSNHCAVIMMTGLGDEDDFGTGYASLSYLKQLPLKTLKIDQSFVKNLLCNQEDRSIITCVVALSQAFGYNLIAEGIESEEHEEAFIAMGCHIGQGYFIAKPMSAAKIPLWIEEYQQRHCVY